MTSYLRSIVTISLCRVVSEIFNVAKCRDLEIGVGGHLESLQVAPFGRSCMVSLASSQGVSKAQMMGLPAG